ncbi:uncharacterized protein LOC119791518 [Cyprinodon tularosa]|uniref:uncharacterized protein LOC119791518 n=1 Tax=Cyprinodon tularosa TaxID=77115 RepID=UPI0018E1F4AA|nr:uncharacterized protein LOC119791518 [Cyprinodon tularosa]
MTLLWITVFMLHQGYALVPVVNVQIGEPVTFTCANIEKFTTTSWLHWYKQTSGDTLKMILMQRKNQDPTYSPEFPSSRFNLTCDDKISNLTILRTVGQDEGIYHCALTDWTGSTWMGTYLMVKGNSKKTSSYTVVHQSTASESSRPEDSETLQCSVLSESENNSCSEDFSMFWFKAGSNRPYPNIIYTDGKRADNCEKSPNTRKKCIYNFPKNISSSDPGTYYCAVATCGEILLGNAIRKEGGETPCYGNMILLITIIFLTISLIVHIFLICYRTQSFGCKIFKESPSEAESNNFNQQSDDIRDEGQDLVYSALHFSGGTKPKGIKKRELKTEEMVYSEVRPSG